ncbi:PH domain leucine-rich repeat-containing protein phosphatase 2 [Aphanomyces cochlioides]|nr:PH domain leucine-rich repeat-containing protein phosphatase 2 [Aphanomyces cochlioides]
MSPTAYFPPWMFTYSIILGVSLIATMLGVWSIKRAANADFSCVIFAIQWLLFTSGLYSFARMVALGILMHSFITGQSTWAKVDEIHDALGVRLVTRDDEIRGNQSDIPLYSSMISLVGDTSNLASSMWMLILFIELVRLGRRSMDRGGALEHRMRRVYLYTTTILLTVYFTTFTVFLCTYHYNEATNEDKDLRWAFLNMRASVTRLASFAMQAISVIAGLIGLLILRLYGELVVGVGGQVAQSPLYNRIKRLVIVDCIFLMPLAVTMSLTEQYRASKSPISPDVLTVIIGICSILYYSSGCALSLTLAGSQACCAAICLCGDVEAAQSFLETTRPPPDNPIFVNTDIESSSALWGQLGSVMHEAQELHDTLLRSLLVRHNGYEITTAGDSFQLAFHTIQDAVAYCLDVQEQLLTVRWPKELANMDGSRSVIHPKKPKLAKSQYLFHGLRVRMGIHAASDNTEGQLFQQTHPVTYKTNYVGLSELIGREVSDLGHGGQIVVTAPVAKWLQKAQRTNDPWTEEHPLVMRELGVYRVKDLKIDLGVAYVVPYNLRERIAYFTPLANVKDADEYTRRSSTTYDLLISPKDVIHII